MNNKVAIYVRVSTDEQRDNGYSIDSQLRMLKEYADKNNYNIVGIYNDAGYSGKNLMRPEMQRLLKDIEDGKIKSSKQIRVLEFLKDVDGIYSSDLQNYTDTNIAVLRALEKKGYIEFVEEQIVRNPFKHKDVEKDEKLPLTDEQKIAFNQVKEKIEKNSYEQFLLYGVTGSR